MSTLAKAQTGFYFGKAWQRRVRLFLTYMVLTFLSWIFLIPLLWLFVASLMPIQQIGAWPPQWIPNPVQWENYTKALYFWNFGRSFKNTTIITVLSMVGELLSCTLVAYGFARLRFPGRNTLFIILLSTMMLPFAVRMVPLYIGFSKIGWVNTFLPLIVPAFFANPFFCLSPTPIFHDHPRRAGGRSPN